MIVLWADNPIFDEGYLLQLAGRVGWSEAYPDGKVWFIAARITREMEGATRKIKLLNEEAQKKGYSDTINQKKKNVTF
jgi:competence protein ComFA